MKTVGKRLLALSMALFVGMHSSAAYASELYPLEQNVRIMDELNRETIADETIETADPGTGELSDAWESAPQNEFVLPENETGDGFASEAETSGEAGETAETVEKDEVEVNGEAEINDESEDSHKAEDKEQEVADHESVTQEATDHEDVIVLGEEEKPVEEDETVGVSLYALEPDENDTYQIQSNEDLVELSLMDPQSYQNATVVITRAGGVNFDLTGTEFAGLGSEDIPFKGTLIVTNGDTSDINIAIDRPFFNGLDQQATLTGLYVQAGANMTEPLLAVRLTNEDNVTEPLGFRLKVGSSLDMEAEEERYCSFGGLIGILTAGSACELSVNNRIPVMALLTGEDNLGFFCNTMEADSSLSIAAYQGNSSFRVSTTGGHAGGLVGAMETGSLLVIRPAMNLIGSVATNGPGKDAGGLVGNVTFGEIIIEDNVIVAGSVNGAGSGDDSTCGGMIGRLMIAESEIHMDLGKCKVQGPVISGGHHTGGLFGVVNYSGKGNLTFENSEVTVTHTGNSGQFGGVVGLYSTDSLGAQLCLVNNKIVLTEVGTTASAGGLIGLLADKASTGALSNASAAYVQVSGCNVTVSGQATNMGGLVGEVGDSGHFLDVNGNVVIASGTTLGGSSVGGLVGRSHSGILRLTGKTDLSGLRFAGTGNRYGQIVGCRGLNASNGAENNMLVYALGNGNGDGVSEYGWCLVRPENPMAISDIGNNGEVLRLDGEVLTEVQRTGASVDPSTVSDPAELLCFNTERHEITPKFKTSGEALVYNLRDFVALSVMIQYTASAAKGAFKSYGLCGSSLLNKKITIDSGLTDIDLSGTGVIGLLRDDGKQTYSGVFEGNGATIALAIGETYGENASAQMGCGQLHNHEAVGLLGILNGTVKNVTLDGTVSFGMVSGGTDVACGAVAGQIQSGILQQVTVKTVTDYNTGAEGGELKIANVGGFFGSATADTKTYSFENCSMQGSIHNHCTAKEFYNAGYVAAINKNNITFIVKDCEIKNAELTAGETPDAGVGGLIGVTGTSAQIVNVGVDGLTIDGLTITNEATNSSGGLLGYRWRGANLVAKDIIAKNSSVTTSGLFGGLVYETSGYWQVGNGSDQGIALEKAIFFSGKSTESQPSSAMISLAHDNSDATKATYVEIKKDGYAIADGEVEVTLSSGGEYFDDIAGITKWADGSSAVVSVGLTENGASEAVLIDTSENGNNTWLNSCLVNGSSDYINGNTRYHYNVDYYRNPNSANYQSQLNLGSSISSGGDLLCWYLYQYGAANIKPYFATAVGGVITGEVDLTGVSYYPVNAYTDIKDAVITFDYESMNSYEESGNNKPFTNKNLQHYQMHTGLFTDIITVITASLNFESVWSAKGLTLRGTFGPYDENRAGVLFCSSAIGGDATYKTILTLDDITLDGIRCTDTSKPLLINTIGTYTSTAVNGLHTTDSYQAEGDSVYAAGSLFGHVGGATARGVNIDFSDIGLDAREEKGAQTRYGTYHTIFTEALFMPSFRYMDENSGGSYNFESTSEYITFGKEISNTDSGRNNFNEGITSQYCYFDTYGTEVYVVDDLGPGTAGKAIADRFASGYLPYVKACENQGGDGTKHELDINQRAYFLIHGCGTYGHPYEIATLLDEHGNVLVTAENQMMALMNVLDGKGSGTVLCVNTEILKKTNEAPELLHNPVKGSAYDKLYIKVGNAWYPAEQQGNHYKKASGNNVISNDDMMCYVRNAYYEIGESFELDLSVYNGIGGKGAKTAFSGVIIGKKIGINQYPTITLRCPEGKTAKGYEVGGLIRFSQGSVIKNLNVVIDGITVNSSGNNQTPSCFGGVIGWVAGGDNIIDNVTVSATEKGISIEGVYSWLTAIGGYVGYVGANDCLMGGGVVFRNINGEGLTEVTYKKQDQNAYVHVDTTLEVTGKNPANERYYWNPFVGRVIEGYACAESGSADNMGSNTDKNYSIPVLDRSDTFTIKETAYGTEHKIDNLPVNSVISVDSAQDLWVLSAIVSSGAGCRATNDCFKKSASSQTKYGDAYYYGRVRTGDYDHIGSVNWSDEDSRDENCVWGGIGELWDSVCYLSTYTDNPHGVAYLTIDTGYRSITMAQGEYDLTAFGSGFRGIGFSYYYDGATSGTAYFGLKIRMLRLCGDALTGNDSIIRYQRNIFEYDQEAGMYFNNTQQPFQVRQAGLFNIYNQFKFNGTVKDLSVCAVIKANQITNRNTSDEKLRTAFAAFAGRTAYNYSNSLIFDNVNVVEGTSISGGFYSAGLMGRMVPYSGSEGDNKQHYIFRNCVVDQIVLEDTVIAGGLSGQSVSFVNIEECKVTDCRLLPRASTSVSVNVGGLIGQVTNNTSNTTYAFNANRSVIDGLIIDANLSGNGSLIGGAIGTIAGANGMASLSNITVSGMQAVTRGYVGGVIGTATANLEYAIKNTQVTDSKIVTMTNDRYAGGLVGQMGNGRLNAYNVLSKNNMVGYLITLNTKSQPTLDTTGVSLVKGEDKFYLTPSNIGIRESNAANKYWTYEAFVANPAGKNLTNSHVGIWVGNGNNKDISIVSASQQGIYSAVNSIGRNKTANSYVIYADYTGTATGDDNSNAASHVDRSPILGLSDDNRALSGDGAGTKDGVAIGKVIMEETAEKDYMKGYFGGTYLRTLDTVLEDFSKDYSEILRMYREEETAALYQGADIPILVLDMTSSAEVNNILQKYTTVLTNHDQQTDAKYVSMKPYTFRFDGAGWNMAPEQSMGNAPDGTLKLNVGKYDNTRNQITVVDVAFPSPISSDDAVYHLYIPVLVKKVMDIYFDVKVANGAVCYDSAYGGNTSTLASFGEDYTAMLTYRYSWTAAEWNDALSGGMDLLWSFGKQVDLDMDESTIHVNANQWIDTEDLRLTLVDMNTHGYATTHYCSYGDILREDGTLMFDALSGYESVPICDLLDITEEEGTEEEPGTLKRVEADDPAACVRRWDAQANEFIYYASLEEDDEDIPTFKLYVSGDYEETDDIEVTEKYYLIMNCTEGTGMFDKVITLGTAKLQGNLPSRVQGSTNATYVLGDFYNLSSMVLQTASELGSDVQIMKLVENDFIDVKLTSQIKVESDTLKSYVINRPVYYRYEVHMTNELGNPVDIQASDILVENVRVGGEEIVRVADTESVSQGYTMTTSGNVTYITIKAPGKLFVADSTDMTKTVIADIRYSYEDGASLLAQFPVRTLDNEESGIRFRATANMAYQKESLGNTNMVISRQESKTYYTEEVSVATLNYDSYNIVSYDGNTSQLGLNGRETQGEAMLIRSRAMFNATGVSGLNRTDPEHVKYPYYLEGRLVLERKTETDKENGIGKEYEQVMLGEYLQNLAFESSGAVIDVDSSHGLGLQADGTYKFRIRLTEAQIADIMAEKILVNIDYEAKTGDGLEAVDGGIYANYKLKLDMVLKNKNLEEVSNEPTDHLIYTNAKVYLGIIGVTDVDGE